MWEQRTDLPPRAPGDDDGVRLRQCLQPRRDIGGLPNDRLFLRRTGADQIAYHHQPGGDADPQLQRSRRLELTDGTHQRQAGSDSLFRVVLVRLRVTEVDEHAVAHVLGDEAVEAAYRLCCAGVIAADDLAQVFGVEPSRKRCRADEEPIEEWLQRLGLPQYGPAFIAADIDPSVLPDLTEADLERLGVTPPQEAAAGDRRPGRGRADSAACTSGCGRSGGRTAPGHRHVLRPWRTNLLPGPPVS
jgi:SAM (Sterile alpha motif) domain-containing protein